MSPADSADAKDRKDQPTSVAETKEDLAPEEKLQAFLKALPEGRLSILAQVFQQWQGPLPPPDWLSGYDKVVPGLADRLMTCFEGQVRHRIGIERTVVVGNMRAQDRGQWFAFILAMSVMALAFLLIMLGQVGWGIGLVVGDVLTLAGLFIYGREGQRSERKRKIDQIVGPRESPTGTDET